jgi:tRNA-dihydrouridine synthase A
MRANPATDTFSVAPMMEWTDRHCRYFHRKLSSHALLYTEMVTTGAILHGDREKLLGFDPAEQPLALQLGGSDPTDLATCARVGETCGYTAINLNVGCPSDRVQSGRFGACLMAEPALVGDCVAAMQAAVDIPVTVKCRVGIDRDDAYEPFAHFIDVVARAGCRVFIVHARKAWLDGLSPKENRDIPPLRHDFVHRAVGEFPECRFILNGGLDDHPAACEHLPVVDGVMMGRAAYRNPWLLSTVDEIYYNQPARPLLRAEVVRDMYPYIESKCAAGVPLGHIGRHMLGLFQGEPGGRLWRRSLSQNMWRKGSGVEVIEEALNVVQEVAAQVAA